LPTDGGDDLAGESEGPSWFVTMQIVSTDHLLLGSDGVGALMVWPMTPGRTRAPRSPAPLRQSSSFCSSVLASAPVW